MSKWRPKHFVVMEMRGNDDTGYKLFAHIRATYGGACRLAQWIRDEYAATDSAIRPLPCHCNQTVCKTASRAGAGQSFFRRGDAIQVLSNAVQRSIEKEEE